MYHNSYLNARLSWLRISLNQLVKFSYNFLIALYYDANESQQGKLFESFYICPVINRKTKINYISFRFSSWTKLLMNCHTIKCILKRRHLVDKRIHLSSVWGIKALFFYWKNITLKLAWYPFLGSEFSKQLNRLWNIILIFLQQASCLFKKIILQIHGNKVVTTNPTKKTQVFSLITRLQSGFTR